MMDYEFRIELLEKELAHARELQALMRGRLDTHEISFSHIAVALKGSAERFERIEKTLERVLEESDARMTRIEQNLDALVRAIAAEHANGRGKE